MLEGGPTLASSFFEADVVDKVMIFLAPTISGAGPRLNAQVAFTRQTARAVGEDVLLIAYVHEP